MNEVQFKEISAQGGRIKVAIFTFVGYDDPTLALDQAVATMWDMKATMNLSTRTWITPG